MNNKQLKETAKKHEPSKHAGKHALIAFLSGGALGATAQLLMRIYMITLGVDQETAMPMCVVTVILVTSILTGFGVFDKAAQVCGAGLFVPITGFANSLTSCALEGKTEGFIYGIGGNMFKLAGSVLTYGIASAFVFGSIRYLLFGA